MCYTPMFRVSSKSRHQTLRAHKPLNIHHKFKKNVEITFCIQPLSIALDQAFHKVQSIYCQLRIVLSWERGRKLSINNKCQGVVHQQSHGFEPVTNTINWDSSSLDKKPKSEGTFLRYWIRVQLIPAPTVYSKSLCLHTQNIKFLHVA